MELRATSRLDHDHALKLCRRYLDRLPLAAERRRALLEMVEDEKDPERAMARLHHALAGTPRVEHAAFSSIRRRLELALPGLMGNGHQARADRACPLPTAPPIRRRSMAPRRWPASLMRRILRGVSTGSRDDVSMPTDTPPETRRVTWAATVRRSVFIALALAQSVAFAYYFATKVLPYHGNEPMELAILTLSTILFGWVSLGFWTALSGFLVLCCARDRYAITRTAVPGTPIAPEARTAVIMPIRNEDVGRVFAGLRATHDSLAATGALERFDFFVLSDSNDPDTLTAEHQAWLRLCTAVGGFGRIFYRWRRHQVKRKSGNVADFCRRWGSRYRYMVVLDADSVMSGQCLVTLVTLMEANPGTGIIQTAPRAAGRDTLYARVQQFATRVYGPVFTAGLHFWQLGESYYWGHNAIIRIAPFMRHCALGRLPGRGPLSGEILSHDFVEAALMRRAGWKVWMAYDLPGSYEEMPPNLLDELKRDRRWCQGNLINARLFMWQGVHPAHRAVFMTGIMAYVSAPLWLLSLAVSTAFVVFQTMVGPQYFTQPRQLFPIWPEWDMDATIGFVLGTAAVLFLPKILGAVLVLRHGAARFGGARGVGLSLVLEMLLSAVLAPIRMLFHTQFVLASLFGLDVHWKSPPRDDAQTTWAEATRRHGLHTLLGAAWLIGIYYLAPWYTWWLLPVFGALVFSIPISVYSSRVSVGRALRRARLFLIPEETDPPRELRIIRAAVEHAGRSAGFVEAVVDPVVNAVVCGVSFPTARFSARAASRRDRLVGAALHRGPSALDPRQKLALLTDPLALSRLHFDVWTSEAAHPDWGIADAPTAMRKRLVLRAAS